MSAGLFLTGTDTDCGKTVVATAIIRTLRASGVRVAGFKPVAAGAVRCDGELRNDDALALAAEAALDLPYAQTNPYCFAPPIAPHLAAEDAGVSIELAPILDAFGALAAASELVVVEGAGGWCVPLAPHLDMAGLAVALGLPVVLVVGLRLGCLNHALLSARAISSAGVPFAGWIGSLVDPDMRHVDRNLATLAARLDAPCLGVVRHPRGPAQLDFAPPLDADRLCAAAGRALA